MKHVFLLLAAALLTRAWTARSSGSSFSVKTTASVQDTLPASDELESDSSYERFMAAVLSTKDVRYLKETLILEQHTRSTGNRPLPEFTCPASFDVGRHRFYRRQIDSPDTSAFDPDQHYWMDSVLVFLFHGRKYAWAAGSIYLCNGSGCAYSCYLFYDYQLNKLHFLDHFAPLGPAGFGDVNGDSVLDIVLPESNNYYTPYLENTDQYSEAQLDSIAAFMKIPYSVRLYTLNASGRLVSLRNPATGGDCSIEATFTNDRHAPRNFTVTDWGCLAPRRYGPGQR